MYLLRIALRPWRLALLSQVFSSFAVGILLFMVLFLYWLQAGLKPVIYHLQAEQVVTAYLKAEIEKKDEPHIVDTIKESVGSQAVTEVSMVDAPQFIRQIEKFYPELAHELGGLGAETHRIVPRYVSITGMIEDSRIEKIKAVSGVESVESSKDRYRPVVGAFRILRWVARLLSFGLGVALLTGLVHLARMNSYLNQDAVSLLRQWGAGSLTQNAPAVISGLMVGALGGVVASGIWVGAGLSLSRHIRGISPLLKNMPIASPTGIIILLAAGVLAGSVAGALGSLQRGSKAWT